MRGGIETWLMHVLRHIDRELLQFDFLVHTDKPCPYDEEARDLGVRIIPCERPSRPLQYRRRLHQILAEYGPYDIVHSHVHFYSGLVLQIAQGAGVRARVCHSHVGVLPEDSAAGPVRRAYLQMSRALLYGAATAGLACSREAAQALYGERWESDPRWNLLYYGIDLEPFRAPLDATVREELGLEPDALVVAHIGRFEEQKNHRFLVQILKSLVAIEPRVQLLSIGAGSLEREIKGMVAEGGLSDRVVFAGLRADVPRILRNAVDAFVLPSLCEGLGLVALEAQAAGVPAILADTVPIEAEVVGELITRASLSDSSDEWAITILEVLRRPRSMGPAAALAQVDAGPFNILRSVDHLSRFYQVMSNPTKRRRQAVAAV